MSETRVCLGFSVLFLMLLAASPASATVAPECSGFLSGHSFSRASPLSATQQPTDIRDLKTFGEAMTKGMLLRPEQDDLFEIYRRIFFGDPNTSVDNATLKTVTDTLKEHPELQKPHFREYEIETVQKVYEAPDSLTRYLKSQNLSPYRRFKTDPETRQNDMGLRLGMIPN